MEKLSNFKSLTFIRGIQAILSWGAQESLGIRYAMYLIPSRNIYSSICFILRIEFILVAIMPNNPHSYTMHVISIFHAKHAAQSPTQFSSFDGLRHWLCLAVQLMKHKEALMISTLPLQLMTVEDLLMPDYGAMNTSSSELAARVAALVARKSWTLVFGISSARILLVNAQNRQKPNLHNVHVY